MTIMKYPLSLLVLGFVPLTSSVAFACTEFIDHTGGEVSITLSTVDKHGRPIVRVIAEDVKVIKQASKTSDKLVEDLTKGLVVHDDPDAPCYNGAILLELPPEDATMIKAMQKSKGKLGLMLEPPNTVQADVNKASREYSNRSREAIVIGGKNYQLGKDGKLVLQK
jgi:hypothetical protein